MAHAGGVVLDFPSFVCRPVPGPWVPSGGGWGRGSGGVGLGSPWAGWHVVACRAARAMPRGWGARRAGRWGAPLGVGQPEALRCREMVFCRAQYWGVFGGAPARWEALPLSGGGHRLLAVGHCWRERVPGSSWGGCARGACVEGERWGRAVLASHEAGLAGRRVSPVGIGVFPLV